MARTYPWKVSDALWEGVEPLIPVRPPHPKGERRAADDRQMISAIVYVLRMGIQWNALPRELGASSTVYDRFRWWESQGFFQRLWQAGQQEYDELAGIGWDWQSVDGSMVKAPFAHAAVGPVPTDGGKQGTKRSILCDRRGIPLALVSEGANCPDMKLLAATLDRQIVELLIERIAEGHDAVGQIIVMAVLDGERHQGDDDEDRAGGDRRARRQHVQEGPEDLRGGREAAPDTGARHLPGLELHD